MSGQRQRPASSPVEALQAIKASAEFAHASGAEFDLERCIALCTQALARPWSFGELTAHQLRDLTSIEEAMRAGELRGLPTDFGALS